MIKFNRVRLAGRTNVDLPIALSSLADPFQVQDISGLGPSEADVFITTSINGVGSFHGRRPRSRQIVVTVKLNPAYDVDETYADLRHKIYEMTSTPTGEISFLLFQDSVDGGEITSTAIAGINGYVSKMDISIFDREPKVQIVIDCVGSNLKAIYPVTKDPFAADNVTDVVVENQGNAPVGFEVNFTMGEDVTDGFYLWAINPSIVDIPTMTIDYDFLQFDKVYINTVPGQRYASVTRNGVKKNLLPYISGEWPKLMVGSNTVAINRRVDTGFPLTIKWGSFSFLPEYMGV